MQFLAYLRARRDASPERFATPVAPPFPPRVTPHAGGGGTAGDRADHPRLFSHSGRSLRGMNELTCHGNAKADARAP